jgi:hypothetical protein
MRDEPARRLRHAERLERAAAVLARAIEVEMERERRRGRALAAAAQATARPAWR